MGETVWNGVTGNDANDQAISANTTLRVDILNAGAEKMCWKGTGNLTVTRPDGTALTGGGLTPNSCVSAAAGVTGAYNIDVLTDQVLGTEWDLRVCASTVSDLNCLNVSNNERLGRLWSSTWDFHQNTQYSQRYSVNGSVYAVVPGGAAGRDAVIEMQMRGVSGAWYSLRANSQGPVLTSNGARVGRSVPKGATYTANAEYPLYLSAPASAQYNWITPQISNVQVTPSCGTGVVLDTAPGSISFTSNVIGQYVVVCDVNKDAAYDFASTADFSSFGTAVVGSNSVSWNGRNNAGANAPEGSYSCIVRLNVGEFHYVADDIETSYPGIRMFRLEADKATRTALRMFWDDTSVPSTQLMPNAQSSPASPLADGLLPGTYATASSAFYFTGGNRAQPNGNARAWGSFSGTAPVKGDEAYLDQFSAADTAISPAFSISVISASGDADTDLLTNARECAIGTNPQDNDSDDDGVYDGYEAPQVGAVPNSDGDALIDALDPDDDGDGIPTSVERGPAENGDGNPADAANSDGAGARDYLDTDSDNDGVLDGTDTARTNPNVCRDVDADSCDDCSVTGANNSGGSTSNDGLDTDVDGQCNLSDPDDDGDGVPDGSDSNPLVKTSCADIDADLCDDCALGLGALPLNDGLDTDGDGSCDVGDSDRDNDGVANAADSAPLNPFVCKDSDNDSCNDCALTGNNLSGGSLSNDGPDSDGDGLCDVGDADRDNDGVANAGDSAPLNPLVCKDSDSDSCDDCSQTGNNLSGGSLTNDGLDSDADGLCDAGDADRDNDGVANTSDSAPLDPGVCRDTDSDGCDDCAITRANGSGGNPANDGVDSDADGQCDLNEADRDNDGVLNAADLAPLNPLVCKDSDNDSCDDCAVTGGNGSGGDPANDGADADLDGLCDAGESDLDGDGVPNGIDSAPNNPNLCRDEDADSCDDCSVSGASGASAPQNDGLDSDADGKCDAGDDDDDGDTVPDDEDSEPLDETQCRDQDRDGCDDCSNGPASTSDDGRDADGDGMCDADTDRDGDGVFDAQDLDDDGDGILDSQENLSGIDPDGDADNDGISNLHDADDRGDGQPNQCETSLRDGVCDEASALFDSDGDGLPNHLDLDADGDMIFDADESGHDAEDNNRDGRVDGAVSANGVADEVELGVDSGIVAAPVDTDGDGTPDFLDLDSDGDKLSDRDEVDDSLETPPIDTDGDGAANFQDADDDGDGIPTQQERSEDGSENIDTDEDGLPDHLDTDDDGDGVPSSDELGSGPAPRDTDKDGIPDYLDTDDDGDGVATTHERSDEQRDQDTDGDGIPDHLDKDDDGDGIPTEDEPADADRDGVPDRLQPAAHGTIAGGARCSVQQVGGNDAGTSSLLGLAGLALLTVLRRKRRRPQLAQLVLLAFFCLGILSATPARAQVALDQFKAPGLTTDGFGLARPELLAPRDWSLSLTLDYANDPLVYEVDTGSSKNEERVVSDQLVGHLGFAIGIVRRLSLFASLPVNLLMTGKKDLTVDVAEADGPGLGDLVLGGRVLLSGDKRSRFASALELVARVPTAELANKDQAYSGDSIGSYEPALMGELRFGRFDVRLRAGARLRKKVQVANLTLSQELLAGIGMRLRLVSSLYLHAEAYGSTFTDDMFARTRTPAESLFGLKNQGQDWTVGVAAGPGLTRGYGSPDVRVVGMLAYAPTEPKPVDSDGDGLLDPNDRCPRDPEDKDGFEDTDGCPDPDNDHDGLLDVSDRCPNEPEDTDDFEDTDGCPDPDNDADGIFDPNDNCPMDPEDKDGFEDSDGCVDPDNDKDGLLDAQDSCPDKPEDLDGFEDNDGCPEEGSGKVKITCEKVEIEEAIYFDTNSDHIQERSFMLLGLIADVLKQAKHIQKLRVAGHTDDRGNDKKNLDLSARRAAAVVRYLTEHGVEPERLASEGYGESKPIADNKKAEGRATNRRVEFEILQQSTVCETPR